MKSSQIRRSPAGMAFTLIELIVVISIIAVLAALIFPAGAAIKKRATISKARLELQQVATAIETYKAKHGFYPPDNPGKPLLNQLYYELVGTTNTAAGAFKTLEGGANIQIADLQVLLGNGVSGFMNVIRSGGDDGGGGGGRQLKDLKPTQYAEIQVNKPTSPRLLVCSIAWPEKLGPVDPALPVTVNPWRYVSSNPTNNPGHFDLWVGIVLSGKTNRISNWSSSPQIVDKP